MAVFIIKYLSLFLVFMIFTSFFAFWTAIRPPKIKSDLTPDYLGFEYENITLTASDGKNLAGWFIPNEKSSKAVVLMHGYPADKGDVLPLMSFLAEDYNLLFFDFRGLGQSEGKFSYLGAREHLDLEAAVQFLEERGFEEMGLWGFSLGGAVALMSVGLPQVKAIVSDSAYAKLSLLAPELFRIPLLDKPLGFLTILWGRLFFGVSDFVVSPAESVRGSQKPILIIHPEDDEVISFKHALIIKEALAENQKAQFWFTRGGHGLPGEDYRSRIKSFFEENL